MNAHTRIQGIDQAVSNSLVLVNSRLALPVKANVRYAIQVLIVKENDPETRFRYRVVSPIGTIVVGEAPGADVVHTPDSTEIIIRADAGWPHRYHGLVDVGPILGDAVIQFGQETAHPSMTILKAESWIMLRPC